MNPSPKTPDPGKFAKSGSEHGEQVALFAWAALIAPRCPELRLLFAIPNGGERNIIVAANLKAEGVKSGVPDVMLPVPRRNFAGLFIEMKKLTGGVVSASQKEWHAALKAQYYHVVVCAGWEEAVRQLCWYLEVDQNGTPTRPVSQPVR